MRRRIHNLAFALGRFFTYRFFEPVDDKLGERAPWIVTGVAMGWYVAWLITAVATGWLWLIGVAVLPTVTMLVVLPLVGFYYREDTKRIQREIDAIQRRIQAFEYIDYR